MSRLAAHAVFCRGRLYHFTVLPLCLSKSVDGDLFCHHLPLRDR